MSVKNTALVVCGAVVLGLFWGTSYIGFSNSLFDWHLATFMEVLLRGACGIVFAVLLGRARRGALWMFAAMFCLQFCAVGARVLGLGFPGVGALVLSIVYGAYSGTLLVSSAWCLYGMLDSALLRWAVPLGFILSYIYGMTAVTLEVSPTANALVSLGCAAFCLFACRHLYLKGSGCDAGEGQGSTASAGSCASSFAGLRSADLPSSMFLAAFALFLILIGVWFRIGAGVEGSLWLVNPPVGFLCIAALIILLCFEVVCGRGVSLWVFSVGTFAAFAVVLVLTAFFWDGFYWLIKGCSGVWLALFQTALYILCVRAPTSVSRASWFGVLQGSALIMLALGNVVGLALFGARPFDKFLFVAFSFVLMLLYMVIAIVGLWPSIRIGVHRPQEVDEAADTDPLTLLCERYGVTSRERDVLERYSRGNSIVRVAEDLGLAVDTVKTHLRHVYTKMGIHSRQDLLDAIGKEQGNH